MPEWLGDGVARALSGVPLAADVHGFDMADPIVVFGLALLVVLVAPLLFERFRIPGLIGLVLAGIALGPHAANLIPEDSLVVPIGSIGLLYLMFLVGLEIDMNRFRQERHNSVLFGMVTFLIPQVAGSLGAHYLLGLSWPAAILMASMFASHTLVPYPIVQRLGLVKERVVTAAAGGTVLTDTLALLVLAVVAETTRGDGLTGAFWLRQSMLLAVYVGAIVWSAPKLSRWFFRRIGDVEGVPGFLFVITFAFVCAALAPFAGLEPIIGTFLAGLTLNLMIPEQSRLMIRLRFVGDALFVPFFLISVGMQVNVGVLVEAPGAWIVMIFMVATGYISKFLAALISGKALHFSRDETGVLFGLSVNQAAATLAAVTVGMRLGIFDERVLNGTILMILATCLLGPWVTERYGRRLALKAGERALESSGAPERIMVPVSAAAQIQPLMSLAAMIRDPQSAEALYPAMIVPESDESEASVAQAENLLANATLQAIESEVPVYSVVRISPNMVDEIIGTTRELRISTLVMDDRLSFPTEFEHVPTRLIRHGRHLAFRFLNPVPLNTCRRLQAGIPPLLERQAGFGAAWAALERLAGQAGAATVQIFAEKSTLQAMERRKHIKPDDPRWERVPLKSWSRAPVELRKRREEHDLTVLFLARTGQLAWDSTFPRLPGLMNRLLHGKPCLIVYPPEMKWEKEQAPADPSPARRFQTLFPSSQVFLNMKEPTVAEAVRRMVHEFYGASEKAVVRKRLLGDLEIMAREAALRVAPDCLLLHSHKAGPPAPMALLATRPEGFAEDDSADPDAPAPRAMILLLGIPAESPEDHLQRLAAISSMFHAGGWIDTVAEAGSYDELIARLQSGAS